MLQLRNNDQNDELLFLNPETGLFEIQAELQSKSLLSTDGFFSFLSGTLFAFYVFQKEIWIRFSDNVIKLTNRITVELELTNLDRIIRIKEGKVLLIEHHYQIPENVIFENDPTPFISDEDFDFGQFLKNIVSDSERQKRFINSP